MARWGNGYFSVNAAGHVQVHPTKDPQRAHRPQGAGRSPPAPRHQPSGPHPVHRHPQAPARRHSRRVPVRHHPAPVPGRLQLRLPDQGEPAAPGRRRGAQLRQAVPASASRPAPSPSCWPWWRSPTTTRRSSATASRTPSTSRRRCSAQKIGRNIIPVVEKYTELGLILEAAEKHRRAAADRHARQAGRARQRALAVVGRLPLEVRPDRHRDHARARGAEGRGMQDCLKLLHFHLGSQITNIRIVKGALNEAGPRLHGAGQARRRPAVHRRRRRPGRGLRRLADQLRVEHELHARGVRQRRRLPHPDRCATRPACRTRPSSRRAAAPSSPITACSCSTCSACRASATRRCRRRRTRSGSSRCIDLIETYNNVTARNALEAFHDAQQALDMALSLFNGRLPAARAAQHGREPVLGDLHQAAAHRRRRWPRCRRICRTSTSSCRTPTSATSRCSSRFPTAGRSSSSSR